MSSDVADIAIISGSLADFATVRYLAGMAVDSQVLAARVRAAIERAGVRHQDVAEAAGISPSGLSRALNEQREFKSLEIALIAEHLGITVDSLISENPSGAQSASTAARIQPGAGPAIEKALSRLNLMLELDRLLVSLGSSNPEAENFPLPAVAVPHIQGARFARNVRGSLGLVGDLPQELDALVQLVEKLLNIDVSLEPLPSGLDGLSAVQGNFRVALISTHISAARQRWTLAHEILHILAGDSIELTVDENTFGVKTPVETRANSFAGEFLVPTDALLVDAKGEELTEEFIGSLLGRFRVSLDALAFRLHNANIVNHEGRDRVRRMSSKAIALRTGRVSDLQARLDRRLPTRLLNRLYDAYLKGQISIRPIASLLDVEPDLLLTELSSPEISGNLMEGEGYEVPVL
ncbi:MAG: helix-turn-helix domain-containing protein [Pseudonocardiaceae bacterium]